MSTENLFENISERTYYILIIRNYPYNDLPGFLESAVYN